MKLTSKSFDRLDSHMSYHNLATLMNNLDIFKTRFTHHETIKIDNKKGVYCVIDNDTKVKKVLKIMIKSSYNDELNKIYNFFLNTPHKNFCHINEILNDDMFVIIIMDHIDGMLLDDYFKLNKKKTNCYHVLFDLIDSLTFLATNNIVHGDIKPSNIVVTKKNIPVIIDYDLSTFIYKKNNMLEKNILSNDLFIKKNISNTSDIHDSSDKHILLKTSKAIKESKESRKSKELKMVIENDNKKHAKHIDERNEYIYGSVTLKKNNDKTNKIIENIEITEKICGTKLFMSPELMHHKQISNKNDVWSLGITMLLCVSIAVLNQSDNDHYITLKNEYEKCCSSFDEYESDLRKKLIENSDVIKKTYGELFLNMLKVMLINDSKKRPSPIILTDIIKKSKYYANNNDKMNDKKIINTSCESTNKLL